VGARQKFTGLRHVATVFLPDTLFCLGVRMSEWWPAVSIVTAPESEA
jgi:hypothetical protein